jgi:hypothetical protein
VCVRYCQWVSWEVEKRAIKPWITLEMISKMDERRKWKNVKTEEGRKNYRRLRI